VTLRRWGDVHAGGESCARAGEGVTLEKYFLSYSGFKSRPSFSITLYCISDARSHKHQIQTIHCAPFLPLAPVIFHSTNFFVLYKSAFNLLSDGDD